MSDFFARLWITLYTLWCLIGIPAFLLYGISSDTWTYAYLIFVWSVIMPPFFYLAWRDK